MFSKFELYKGEHSVKPKKSRQERYGRDYRRIKGTET